MIKYVEVDVHVAYPLYLSNALRYHMHMRSIPTDLQATPLFGLTPYATPTHIPTC